MTFAASGAFYANKYFQIQKYYQIFLSDDFNSWFLPKHSHLTAVLGVIPDVMHALVLNFALMEFTFLVLTFLDLYARYGDLMSNCLEQTKSSEHEVAWVAGNLNDRESHDELYVGKTGATFESFSGTDTLEMLKQCLDLLNSVCGLNLCALVTAGTMTVTWLTFGFATEGATFGLSALLSILLTFTIIAGLGEHFESTVSH